MLSVKSGSDEVESDENQSSVTLLKKLVSTAPAFGKIQESFDSVTDS